MKIIELVLTNFWAFMAALILLTVIGEAIADIVAAARGKRQ